MRIFFVGFLLNDFKVERLRQAQPDSYEMTIIMLNFKGI